MKALRPKHFLAISFLLGLFPEIVFSAPAFDHRYPKWDGLLRSYVKEGLVDYASLKKSPQLLEDYLKTLKEVSRDEYDKWTRDQKIALWINAYNAAVIELVVDNYPLQKGPGWKAFAYPKNSIQQIPKVWNRKALEMFGKKLSLNQIEHEILRKEFREPRIHFALVCASLGCPVLRGEPYRGDALESQLTDQVRSFVTNSEKVRYDARTDTLFLSSIFRWFDEDFERAGGVLAFIRDNLPHKTADKISGQTKIDWLKYNWSLNERK